MTAVVALLTTVLIFLVVLLVSAPFRSARGASTQDPELEDLEAARAAKYREIRDTEADFRTGKLSRADYEAVDAALRGEAVEILDRLQAAGGLDASVEGGRGDSNPLLKGEILPQNALNPPPNSQAKDEADTQGESLSG